MISRTRDVAHIIVQHCRTRTKTAMRSSRLVTQASANVRKLDSVAADIEQLKSVKFIMNAMQGCILKIANIPPEMDLQLLRSEMDTYGKVVRWVHSPSPVQPVFVVYETKDMAMAAKVGLREHRRLVVTHAEMDS